MPTCFQTYNQLVMQSLAQQMQQKGLDPAPWLQLVNFSESVQYRYQLQRAKQKRHLNKFKVGWDLDWFVYMTFVSCKLNNFSNEDVYQ